MSLVKRCIIWLLLGIFVVKIHNLLPICLPFPFMTDVERKSWKEGSDVIHRTWLLTKLHTVIVIQKSSFCQKLVLLYEIQRRVGLCHTVLKYLWRICLFWKQLVEVFHNSIVDFLTTLYWLQTVFKSPGCTLLCDQHSCVTALGVLVLPQQEITKRFGWPGLKGSCKFFWP